MLHYYLAKCARVVDGDTIDLEWLDLGWGVHLRPTLAEPLRLRFAEINAFETTLRGGTTEAQKALGLEAKAWLASEIEGKEIIVRSVKGGDRGNFGRFLVWVWPGDASMLDATYSYNDLLVNRGWAVRA